MRGAALTSAEGAKGCASSEPGGHDEAALLAERVANARALREHHVWQAAKAFWLDGRKETSVPARRRFAGLVDADALVDAVLTLVAAASPPRAIEAVTHEEGRWTCRMRVAFESAPRSFSATHADLAAAILETFLLTIPEDAPAPRTEPADHGQSPEA